MVMAKKKMMVKLGFLNQAWVYWWYNFCYVGQRPHLSLEMKNEWIKRIPQLEENHILMLYNSKLIEKLSLTLIHTNIIFQEP